VHIDRYLYSIGPIDPVGSHSSSQIQAMSLLTIIGLRYGITLGKVLYSLKTGDFKAAAEGLLKLPETEAADKAKTLVGAPTVESILREVEKELKKDRKWTGTDEEHEQAASEAAETFGAGFSFSSLAENLATADRLPEIWRRGRSSPLPSLNTPLRDRHDALLAATAIALVPRLNELSGFQNWYVGFVVEHFAEVLEHASTLEDAFNALSANVGKFLGRQGVEDAVFERAYRAAATRNFDLVELFIERQDVGPESRRQELTVAYVTLELTRGRAWESVVVGVPADNFLDNLPEGPQRVLILGPAGCGKTTLLRWLGLEAARPKLPEIPGTRISEPDQTTNRNRESASAWREKVPLLVRLRDWPAGDFPTSDHFHVGSKCVAKISVGWAERILRAGRGLLLLDGLDELSPDRRREALDWIREMTETYSPGNVFVATSRPQALPAGVLNDTGFVEYEVRDLSPSGRIEFVEKWHEAVKRRYRDASDQCQVLDEKQRRLVLELEANSSVSLLASNPLLCALLCALNRVYTQSLPENLRDLCDSACKMLLWDRDQLIGAAKQAAPPAYAALNYEMRLLVARNLAYAIAKESNSTLPRAAAVDEIWTTLHGAANPDRNEAEGVLKGLIERSNLLRDCGEHEVEFVHNALRDYLASLLFVVRCDSNFLVEKTDAGELERWEPVILFAAATTQSETFGTELLRAILNFRQRGVIALMGLNNLTGGDRRRRELLALKVSRQVRYRLPPNLERQLDAIREQMLPVDSATKAEILANAGEAALEYLEYEDNRQINVAAACIRGMRRIGGDRAKTRLIEYLNRDQRPEILEELWQALTVEEVTAVVNPLLIPSMLRTIQESYPKSASYVSCITDLSPLRELAGIQRLYLQNSRVSDLSPLNGLVDLLYLSISHTPVNDLSPLIGIVGLLELTLDYTKVTDISPLNGMIRLLSLSLGNTHVTDLSPLNGMVELRTLIMENTEVSDLSPLRGLAGLRSLFLDNTQVSDLSPLRGLAELNVLTLDDTHVSDLSPLRGLAGLEQLSLDNTDVRDISPLSGMAKLQELSLSHTHVQDLSPLDSLFDLNWVTLYDTNINHAEIKRVNRIRKSVGWPRLTISY
jgi:hypothetical protein